MYVWVSFYIVSGRYSWWWEILMGLNKKKILLIILFILLFKDGILEDIKSWLLWRDGFVFEG